jgi:16S rRNA (guanine527-N7)-methyltransferase
VAASSSDVLADLLNAFPAIVGRPATDEDRHQFQRYLDLFSRWNRVHRMTALASPREIVHGLFLDSLLFLRVLPPRPLKVVDIGAGSGIPGLPIRLADPAISLTLIEAKRKRVSFLLTVCRELNLSDVKVLEGRAERLVEEAPEIAGSFDAAVARAVGAAADLVPLACRYLGPGGVVVLGGSPRKVGGGHMEVVKVPIPGGRQTRVFLRAEKESSVPRGTEQGSMPYVPRGTREKGH